MSEHKYVSTACQHGIHERCRLVCKFCDQSCRCNCGHEFAAPGWHAKKMGSQGAWTVTDRSGLNAAVFYREVPDAEARARKLAAILNEVSA